MEARYSCVSIDYEKEFVAFVVTPLIPHGVSLEKWPASLYLKVEIIPRCGKEWRWKWTVAQVVDECKEWLVTEMGWPEVDGEF